MKKIPFIPLLRTRPQLNNVGQLVKATHAIQRALGIRPVPMPGASPTEAPARHRWTGPAANDVEDAVVVTPSARANPAEAPPAQGSFTRIALRHEGVLRHYKLFVPPAAATSAKTPLPLVVMLHGCKQNPDDFATGTGMNTWGAKQGFLVMYPEQATTHNPQHCWNWFRPENQVRGGGETALLAAMVQDVVQKQPVDPRRIFAAGLSAGGAMAAVLGQQYPDLFAAVGVHSGVVAGGAHDVMSAFSAMKSGAKGHRTAATAPSVPTIVFHGDADSTVHPRNADQITQAAMCGVADAPLQCSTGHGKSAQGRSYTRKVFRAPDGSTHAEQWTVHGSGHAWSGGTPEGSYTDPQGPDASVEMLRFFMEHPQRKIE